jgi:hypothetical protein
MAHYVIIEQCTKKGHQRFFDMLLPCHGERAWYRNLRSFESFKKREQDRTTSNKGWHKSGGGLWYYCAWEDDFKCSQRAFESTMRKYKKEMEPVTDPTKIRSGPQIIEKIECISMAQFYSYVGWDHPHKKWLPESKVMTWQ